MWESHTGTNFIIHVYSLYIYNSWNSIYIRTLCDQNYLIVLNVKVRLNPVSQLTLEQEILLDIISGMIFNFTSISGMQYLKPKFNFKMWGKTS